VKLSHTRAATSARFDDPNLVGCAGLVPVLALADAAGLSGLAGAHLSVPGDKGANAGLKVASLVAGMVAGADSIDDMSLLRHGGMGRVFARAYAPSTLGSFLRAFTFGHVRQLDALASRFLTNLAAQAPQVLRVGTDARVLVDVDDTIIEVHGHAKQGAGFGYSRVRGLNALIATLATETSAPVIVAHKGWSMGGSFQRALLCDIRVAAEGARFRLPEVTYGVIPDTGGVSVLYEMCGPGLVSDMVLTGRILSADEALAHGIVSRVVPEAELDAVAREMAEQIAAARTRATHDLRIADNTGKGMWCKDWAPAQAIEAIVAAREGSDGSGGGPFRSLFDFCARVDRQRINKRVIEALIKAGAFDKLHADRASLLASVSLALDWADTQAAHADQVGLFDFGDSHAASTHEPALVAAAPWDVKERLTLEKTAIGFFLSGHLFEQSEAEVRQFCRTRIADLVDSREPQLLAGIAGEMRVVNGQRGRVMIFKLDDRSEVIEAVVNEELIEAHRDLLKEDELLVVQGRIKLDRFSGGLRLDVAQVWDLAGARARFGRYLAVAVNGIPVPVRELLRQWPARKQHTEQGDLEQGLGVRLQLRRADAMADLDLGDQARFWPCDEALARWRSVAQAGQASIVYSA